MYCKNCGKEITPGIKFCGHCGRIIGQMESEPRKAQESTIYGPAYIGSRLLNLFLDSIISVVLLALLALIGVFILNETFLGWILGFFYFGGYYLFFEGIWQRTPAKWITGTKVVMNDGSKPDFLHILGRTLSRLIPFESISFLAGPIGWHDRLSKTLVVPRGYSPEEVLKINPKVSVKTKGNMIVMIIACVLGGIAIISILATLLLLQLGTARAHARDAKRIADVNQIRMAIEQYYENHGGVYPTDIDRDSIGEYITEIPIDPLTNEEYGYLSGPADHPTAYVVYTELEQTAAALAYDSDIEGGEFDGGQEACTETPDDCIYDWGYLPN